MRFSKGFVRAALGVGLLFTAGTAVRALILMDKSAAQKQRADIGKQGAKNALCMAKASLKCEANGTSVMPECKLVNPASSTVPDPKNKIIPQLTAALDKCESKLDYAKKSATGNPVTDYTGIGCPGDSDTGTAGDQPFADLTAYQNNVGLSTRTQLEALGTVLSVICADNQCAVDQGTLGLAYAKGLFKCFGKCEDDYKNKAGNGGDTDSTTNCNPTTGDSNMVACAGAALSKAQKKGMLNATLKLAIENALVIATNDLYNQDDCP